MDRYFATGTITAVTASPGDTALAIIGNTLTRGRIFYYALSCAGTPVADNMIDWYVRRLTADGTGTSLTPGLEDAAAPVAQLTAKQNYTVEPTYATVPIHELAVHQRSLAQWNAAPRGELVIPASAAAGIGFTPIHASYASTATAVAHWEE